MMMRKSALYVRKRNHKKKHITEEKQEKTSKVTTMIE